MSKPQTNRIRNTAVEVEPWQGSMSEMERILSTTQPSAVGEAGKAYKAAADKFNHTVGELRTQAAALANVWKGKDADEAQKQMQRLHASAQELGVRSGQTGVALSDHAEKLAWYKEKRPKEGFVKFVDGGDIASFAWGGLVGVAAKRAFIGSEEDNAAREHMNRLQGRTLEANNVMPEDLTTDLPSPDGSIDEGPPGKYPPGGHPPGGMPPGGMPPGGHTPGGMPGGGGNLPKDPFGHGGGNLPHDPYGHGGGGGNLPKDPFGGGGGGGTELAGMPHGPGGAGGGGLGGDPFGKGGLGGGAGGGLGGGPGGLSGGAPGMPGGLGGGAPGAGTGRGMGGRGAGGMGGAPMGGGAGGGGKGGDEERERSTWLTEDEDVWGGNDGDTAPPVIG